MRTKIKASAAEAALILFVYVVAKATTHKYSRVATQTPKTLGSSKASVLAAAILRFQNPESCTKRSPLIGYLASQAVGCHPEASGSFLKWVLVVNGPLRY